MSYEKYIYKLLLENDTVIIPGLGAFVSEYKPAQISENSDEIKPPSKTISFNQQIRNNDGLFVGYVADNERISHFEALKRIENERDEILYKLDNGEEVEISDVGLLSYDEDGGIVFKATNDEIVLLDTFGLEATSLVEEPEDTTKVEEEVEILEESEEKASEEKVVVVSGGDSNVEKEKIIEEKKLEEEDADKKDQDVEEEDTVDEKKEEPETTASVTEQNKKDVSGEEKKKNNSWLFILLILIPLIIISIFYFKGCNKKENVKRHKKTVIDKPQKTVTKKNTVVLDSMVVAKKDSLRADSVKVDSLMNTESVESQESDTPKYYLVGGGFSIKENADEYIERLKSKGYNAFYVGQKGRLHIVAIGVYNTFKEARQANWEYRAEHPNSEPWIYKK